MSTFCQLYKMEMQHTYRGLFAKAFVSKTFISFFYICNARTRLCDQGLQVIFLEKLVYEPTPSYCYIATISHISFRSSCFKHKWPCWPGCFKEAEVSVKTIVIQGVP